MPAVQMPDGSTVDLPDNPSPELKAAVQAKVELFHLGKMREQAQQDYDTSLNTPAPASRQTALAKQKAGFLGELFPGLVVPANDPATQADRADFAARDQKRLAAKGQLEAIDAEIAKRKDALARVNAMQGDWWDKTKYYAGQGGSAMLRGLMALPVMAASAGIATDPGRYPKDVTPATPLVDLSRLGMQPQTTGEKYAARAIEGATGAVAGPGGLAAPVRSAVVGGSAGLGSEAAAETLGDNPVTRILGALVGGGTAGLATAAKTTRGDLAREATRDATEADMRIAQELMRRSQEQGVTLNLSQAMPKASNIDEMVNVLAQSKNGQEVARTLRMQPTDVAMGVERELAGLPGTARQPQLAANNVQEAATGALNTLKQQRTALWQQTLQKGIQAIEDSKVPVIQQAGQNLQAAQAARQALEKQLPQLRQALEAARGSDAVAVTAANQQVQNTLSKIQALETFSLPRGSAVGNTGRLLELPSRGASIDMDQIAREVQASRLRNNLTPQVTPAPSLTTLQLQKQLGDLEGQFTQAATREQAAQTALRGAKESAQQATQVPPQAVLAEATRLQALAQGELLNTPKGKALQNLASSMFDSAGNPITSAQNLNEVLKAAGAKLKGINLDTPGLDAGAVKFLQSQIAESRQRLGAAFKPIQSANAAYEGFTEGVYNPMKQSVVGRIAGKGFDPTTEAVQSRVFGVLEKGTTPGASTSEILTLEKALRNQPNGPAAFQDAVKTWMSNKISEATAQQGGRPAEATAANLEKIFMGNDVKSQGFKDMLVALARSQGLKDDALLDGMQNMMRITSAAARRPGTVAGVTPQGLEQASRSRLFGGIGNFSAVQPIRQPFKAIDDALNADAYSFMDKLLTTPEGVDTLIKLGRQPVMSKAAADTLATFSATVPTAQNPNQRKTGQQ